jgi:hypothetical protein
LRNIVGILLIATFAALCTGVPGSAHAVEISHSYTFKNGISVTVYTAEGILSEMTGRDDHGNLVFYPAGGGKYFFIESVEFPEICNKGAGKFFPMDEETALAAIGEIDVGGRPAQLSIDVYLLPMPRLHYLRSTATEGRIFLSPGVWEPSAEMVSSVVTHEVGHCFQRFHMPWTDTATWDEYLRIRGILGDPAYSERSMHMNRPSEIFAEDFRMLFGGELAVRSGTIENPNLPLPSDVAGLEEFMAGLTGQFAVSEVCASGTRIAEIGNYPNPFNPVTTIRAELSGPVSGTNVRVRVYAADGSLVRSLWSGTVSQGSFETVWDGSNDRGERVASGIYFYRISAGEDCRTGKMLLVR